MDSPDLYDETITLPRAVRFPVELIVPAGFDAERPETWPVLAGRLEYVDGRLLYMPPCGQLQQYTVTDVVITLGTWLRQHPDFVLGTNEAGMRLLQSTRAADAAIWGRADLGPLHSGLARVAPILAVEVAGADEDEDRMREKADWYLRAGVRIVWIVLPDAREIVVITGTGMERYHRGETLPEHPALPGLAPRVDEFFYQIEH
jgi:Uma2 family endonuclease